MGATHLDFPFRGATDASTKRTGIRKCEWLTKYRHHSRKAIDCYGWFNGHVGQKSTCLNHSHRTGKIVSRGELCERKISSASARTILAPRRQAAWRGWGLTVISVALVAFGLGNFQLIRTSPCPVVEGNLWDIREEFKNGSTRFMITDATGQAVMILCSHRRAGFCAGRTGASAVRRVQQQAGDGYAERAVRGVAPAGVVGRRGLLGLGGDRTVSWTSCVSPIGEDQAGWDRSAAVGTATVVSQTSRPELLT